MHGLENVKHPSFVFTDWPRRGSRGLAIKVQRSSDTELLVAAAGPGVAHFNRTCPSQVQTAAKCLDSCIPRTAASQ